jgi:hypothetical protein
MAKASHGGHGGHGGGADWWLKLFGEYRGYRCQNQAKGEMHRIEVTAPWILGFLDPRLFSLQLTQDRNQPLNQVEPAGSAERNDKRGYERIRDQGGENPVADTRDCLDDSTVTLPEGI